MWAHLLASWASFYSDSAVTRTLVGFAHIAGLVVSGGAAIALDRLTLKAARDNGLARHSHLRLLQSAHRVVVGGLAIVIASGLLLLAADVDTYWHSRVFWLKMGLVALLLINGWWLARNGRAAELGSSREWRRLRASAVLSIALWLATTLAGAALPNV